MTHCVAAVKWCHCTISYLTAPGILYGYPCYDPAVKACGTKSPVLLISFMLVCKSSFFFYREPQTAMFVMRTEKENALLAISPNGGAFVMRSCKKNLQ